MTDILQDQLVDFVELLPPIYTDRIATLRITRTEYQNRGVPERVYQRHGAQLHG